MLDGFGVGVEFVVAPNAISDMTDKATTSKRENIRSIFRICARVWILGEVGLSSSYVSLNLLAKPLINLLADFARVVGV